MRNLELYQNIRKSYPGIKGLSYGETEYLMSMFAEPEITAIVSDTCINKLSGHLCKKALKEDTLPIRVLKNYSPADPWHGDGSDDWMNKAKTIVSITRMKNTFTYMNHTKSGTDIEGMGFPLSIEVDMHSYNWWFRFWDMERHILVLANVSRFEIKEIGIARPELENDIEDEILKLPKTSVELKIALKKNALERVSAVFSGYEREVHKPKDEPVIYMKLRLYDFDLQIVESKIMSFGSLITVISPQSLRESVIKKIQENIRIADGEGNDALYKG